MLYFAYGSNLSIDRLYKRCPSSRYIGTATLHGYTLVFRGRPKDAKATIVKAPHGVVVGAVFDMAELDGIALDRFEGTPEVYRRATVRVIDWEGYEATVITYMMTAKTDGRPRESYLNHIRSGYKDCGLPLGMIDVAMTGKLPVKAARVVEEDWDWELGWEC